jgi:rubrerythrin
MQKGYARTMKVLRSGSDEYIRRSDAASFFEKSNKVMWHKDDVAYSVSFNVPAADVVEVRHGEWLPDYETFVDEWERESEPIQTGWVCSLCGRQEFAKEPYCPNCGAKMDGKGENE